MGGMGRQMIYVDQYGRQITDFDCIPICSQGNNNLELGTCRERGKQIMKLINTWIQTKL